MSPIISLFLTTLLVSAASSAFAANDCSEQFRNEGKIIPRALIAKGRGTFGQLSMSRILSQIESVKVVSSADLLGSKDMRSTARWTKTAAGLTVEVDCAWYNKFPLATRSVLAFHEYLWSLGMYDEIYWLSFGGYLLTQPLTHQALRPDEVQKIETWMTKIAAKSGGVVGVGGGGEIETVQCRLEPMMRALQVIKTAQSPEQREAALEIFETKLTQDLNCISGHRLNRGAFR